MEKFIVLFFSAIILTGCATVSHDTTQPVKMTTAHNAARPIVAKDPVFVALYKKGQQPKAPYKIIGQEVVSKYNSAGFKRQQANILDSMRSLAASMGGDAIINMAHDDKSVTGTVIAYDPNGGNDNKG